VHIRTCNKNCDRKQHNLFGEITKNELTCDVSENNFYGRKTKEVHKWLEIPEISLHRCHLIADQRIEEK